MAGSRARSLLSGDLAEVCPVPATFYERASVLGLGRQPPLVALPRAR